jgi:hypothetical protein
MSLKKLLEKTKKRYKITDAELARLLNIDRQRLYMMKQGTGKDIIKHYRILEFLRKANRLTVNQLIKYLGD